MLRILMILAAFGMLCLTAYATQDQPQTGPRAEEPQVKSKSKAQKQQDQDQPQPDAKAQEPASIEVYRLKNADPNDAAQALYMLLGRPNPIAAGARSTTGKAAKGGKGGAGGGAGGAGGFGGAGGGNGGPGGGAAGGAGGPVGTSQDLENLLLNQLQSQTAKSRNSAAPSTGVVCNALADPRTRSLVVRGAEKDQRLAADLVAVLDTPDNKPLPDVKAVKAFRLQHLDANDFVGILRVLDPNMSYHLAPVGRMKLVIASGTEKEMQELADAVKKLDIPAEMK